MDVIKVIWGRNVGSAVCPDHDRPAATAHGRRIRRRLQNYKPTTVPMYASTSSAPASGTQGNGQDFSDEEIWKLNRGGNDPSQGLRLPITRDVNHQGSAHGHSAKTIKFMAPGTGQGQNTRHNNEKVDIESLKKIPRSCSYIRSMTKDLEKLSLLKPEKGVPS